ncbi:non-ribosomal peptide synthetase [Cupriavidus agavae]|uniref:Non-ribosomal peptide synthase protein (TIGR01720 family)/amino acid adenylation domain-containing protein n=1 Tax=Cupriavidus agavae TaxID=1001822 RepID=A0A4Q7RZ66_9BURK|nr:non-ribosomal peptide synthetase [Cupriavidus agavae]RZT39145.1 non-ribosomal peptide synthase protein (TIGR01720 family)/amino acid adenylation domain-containing protein [Cupriavidus agavae]
MTPSPSAEQAALLALLLEQDADAPPASGTASPAGDDVHDAPLSFSQQRLWFLLQYEPGSTAYNQTRAFVLRGALDRTVLAAALRAVVARHPALRTRFVANAATPGALPRQVVEAAPVFALAEAALAPGIEALHARIDAEAARPFDLAEAPMLRATLLTRGADDHVLLLSLHHIVSDAVSNAVIARDLSTAYGQALAGDTAQLPAPAGSFAAHARRQHERLASGALDAQRDWWRRLLGSHVPALQLPTDRPHGAQPERTARRVDAPLPATLANALRAFCTAQRCTPFVALLAAWQAVLGRYAGQDDFAVGVPHAGRDGHGLDDVVGFFANTHVYRSRVTPGMTGRRLCEALRADALGALGHADLPFEVLLDGMQVPRDAGRTPLFQVMFNLRTVANAAAPATLTLPGLRIEAIEARETGAKFDLILDVEHAPDATTLHLEYDCSLYDDGTAQRLLRHYVAQLAGMLRDPDLPITAAPLLDPADADDATALARQHVAGVPLQRVASPEPAHHQIARHAAHRPDAIALRHGEAVMTYGELDRRANRLAHRLIALGVRPEGRVGIALERSPAMIVAMLAILKAGGAYVPFDPAYPAERLAYLFDDSGIAALLTQASLRHLLPERDGLPVLLPDSDYPANDAWPDSAPAVTVGPNNLAYVIYTSGSTGRPKGAQLEHGNLSRLLAATQHWFGFGASDVWTLFHSYAFDFSVWEIFGALCHGGELVIVPFHVSRSPQDFIALLRQDRVTVLNQTPSAFRALLAQPELYEAPLALRHVIFGGEALDPQALQPWIDRFGDAAPRLINMYGITETTVHVTYRPITRADLAPRAGTRSPIGERIPDLGVRVLDPGLNPVPPGVAGELYIAGDGLARGYLNRPGLTAGRFIPDPFGGDGARLYRTGDLARWLPDGELEYLGRIDQQVKVRGFRIEPGEIEARIMAHGGIGNAAVVALDGPSGARLVAYVVPVAGVMPDIAALRAALAELLPDYMVPAAFVVIDALPLTPNGKLDRRALPAPAFDHAQDFVAPEGDAETALAAIWAEVLGLPRVGRADNFFELGGDSILSLQIVARARAAGWTLTPRQLFERQTLAELAAVAARAAQDCNDDAVPPTGQVPLLPIQADFFAMPVAHRHHWNQSVLLDCQAAPDPDALAAALGDLAAHHDALRMRFTEQAGGWQQSYASLERHPDLLWERQARSEAERLAHCEAAQRSLDLQRGPLLRAVTLQTGDACQLLLVIHHLVVDGVSWRVLVEDLLSAYQSRLRGAAPALPARTASYQRWSLALREHLADRTDEMPHWQALAGVEATLPVDTAGAPPTLAARGDVTVTLPADLTQALLQRAPAAYRTRVNDLLLTAVARAVSGWTGRTRVLVDLESHGRATGVDDTIDLSRTVGWFTTLFPVALDANGEIGDAIRAVKEQLRAVPGEGIGFGLLRHFGTPAQRQALAAVPHPEIVFNYLGQFDATLAAGSPWRRSAGVMGATQDPSAPLSHPLSISGQVCDGQLQLTLAFSRTRHHAATIERLADTIRTELDAVVRHCTSGAQGVTPSDFPLAGLTQAGLDALGLDAAQVHDLYPLSPMQAGMLFHCLYAPDGSAYTNQLRVDVAGLDPARFIAAWNAALARHDSLRSGFLPRGEQPLQWVARDVPLPVIAEDWTGRNAAEIDTFARAQLAQRFDLAHPPLMRLALLRTGADQHHLVWTVHHLLLDGWSTAQLLGEVLRHYAGEPPAPAGGRFADYIGWLQARDTTASETFWRATLQPLDEPTRLMAALPAPASGEGHTEQHLLLDAAETAALATFARNQKVTLNTLVQAAWLLVLQRCTGQQCVAFGATVAGRPADLPAAQQMLGLFINTLPVVASPAPEQTVGDWLRHVQALNLALREHEQTPLYDIQRWAGHGGQALFDSIVVFENYPVDAALRTAPGGLAFGNVSNRAETNYPLTLVLAQTDVLRLTCRFDRARLDEALAARLADSLCHVMRQMAGDPGRLLGQIGLTAGAPMPAVTDEPGQPLAHYRFEAHAATTPDAIALVADGHTLSYRDLNRRANALAARLMAHGVGPDVPVGVLAERSVELVVGLLAVLKAGGVYVPFDPDYPADRLAFMVEDSRVALLLTRHADSALIDACTVPVIDLDEPTPDAAEAANPAVDLHPAHLAYVIYTSGSTGRPKGVGVSHAALAHYLHGVLAPLALPQGLRMAMVSTPAADLGHTVLFGALASGAALHLPERRCVFDAAAFGRYMAEHGIGVLKIVPSHLRALLDGAAAAGVAEADLLPAHTLVLGGEATDATLRARLHAARPACRLLNHYGPTETTVGVLVHAAGTTPHPGAGLPLGQPLAGTSAYVLDTELSPQPTGVAGELYLGGPALARGYLGRAALTADRFVPDPFAGGARLYRTGDRVRRHADGRFEYLGRIDDQVKIRGFRVEPGEVAAQLAALPGIRQAAVVADLAGTGMQLVGYAVPDDGMQPDSADLRRALAAVLPGHMVPATICLLDTLPLTANGKLDRRALPKPDAPAATPGEAPQGELETRLAAIWQDLLRVPAVHRHDNFFALGGHSLLAVQLLSRIQGELGIDAPLALLFGAATLAELAAALPQQQRHADETALLELEAFANSLESV